jgi:hypothetical protein
MIFDLTANIQRDIPTTLPTDRNYSSLELSKPDQVAVKILPADYGLCAVEDLVVLIADMLSVIIQKNDRRTLRNYELTRFHSRFVV